MQAKLALEDAAASRVAADGALHERGSGRNGDVDDRVDARSAALVLLDAEM